MSSWSASYFRLPELGITLLSSIFRWPEIDFSQLTASWSSPSFRWFDFSIVDDVLWAFVTVLESLVLVAMLCCFFIFCGCTL